MNPEEIFKKIIYYGKIVRTGGHDGLKAWENIKGLFTDQLTGTWKIARYVNGEEIDNIEDIYNYVHDELGMKGEETDDQSDNNLWGKQHFFLQLVRIIKNNPEFSFVRLAQIAYNIGQLSIYIESDELFKPEPIQKYYKENNLDLISSYANLNEYLIEELERLGDQIDAKIQEIETGGGVLTGGNNKYYLKYLKYVGKNIKLKQQLNML